MKILFSKLTLVFMSLMFCNLTFADETANRIVVDPNSPDAAAAFSLGDETMRLRIVGRDDGRLKSELSFPMCDRYTNARSRKKKFVKLANELLQEAIDDNKLLSINPLIDVDTNFEMCSDEDRSKALLKIFDVVER